MKIKRLLLGIVYLLALPFACLIKKNKTTVVRNGIYYFESWATYHIPFKPTDEITKEQAMSPDNKYAYYVGYYEKGVLMIFEKHFNNLIEWRDVYTYWPNTKILQKREMFHFEPDVLPYQIQNFDEKGDMIDK